MIVQTLPLIMCYIFNYIANNDYLDQRSIALGSTLYTENKKQETQSTFPMFPSIFPLKEETKVKKKPNAPNNINQTSIKGYLDRTPTTIQSTQPIVKNQKAIETHQRTFRKTMFVPTSLKQNRRKKKRKGEYFNTQSHAAQHANYRIVVLFFSSSAPCFFRFYENYCDASLARNEAELSRGAIQKVKT